MNPDFLDQLADVDVPPVPAQFSRELHQRVNRSLTALQFLELGLAAFPQAIFELGRALAGLVRFTLMGKYDAGQRSRRTDR